MAPAAPRAYPILPVPTSLKSVTDLGDPGLGPRHAEDALVLQAWGG